MKQVYTDVWPGSLPVTIEEFRNRRWAIGFRFHGTWGCNHRWEPITGFGSGVCGKVEWEAWRLIADFDCIGKSDRVLIEYWFPTPYIVDYSERIEVDMRKATIEGAPIYALLSKKIKYRSIDD